MDSDNKSKPSGNNFLLCNKSIKMLKEMRQNRKKA